MSSPDDLDLSVCIINWNTCARLRACLDGLRRGQHGCRHEVIVVDNASSDGSAEMVGREFSGVHLVRNTTNLGFARANNQAVRLARGRNVLFLNSDTEVQPGALRALCDYLDAHDDVGAVGPLVLGSDGRPQRSYRRLPTPAALLHRLSIVRATGLCHRAHQRYRRTGFDPQHEGDVEVLMGAALAMRTSVAHTLGPWDPGYEFGMEDADLCLRLGRQYRLCFLPDAVVVHHGRESSRLNTHFVYRGYQRGIVRYLVASAHPWAATWYKLLWMLDLPFAAGLLAARWLWRRWVQRNSAGASKTHQRLGAMLAFAQHDWRALLQTCSRPDDRPRAAR